MATQFMPHYDAHAAAGPQSSHKVGHQAAFAHRNTNGRSFAFRKRYERIDWRRIASVDVDQVARTLDFNALQDNIMNLTFCNIEAELDVRMVDPNFIKLFKLAQLTIEYLLHSQEYMTGVVSNMEEKIKKEEEDHAETKAQLEKVKKELADTKKESHKRKKLLMAQQQLIHAGSGSYNKCPFCPKAFLNSSFLQSHINRRHNDFSGKAASVAVGAEQSTGQIPMVAKETKEVFQQFQVQPEQVKTVHEVSAPKSPDTTAKMEVIRVQEEDKKEIEKVKEMFMRELREMNEKYQSSERAMMEMEQRYSKRSNLGDLQDDIDNERELLRQQKEEVAMLKEQLENQLRNASLESSTRTSERDRSRRGAAASPERTTPRGGQPSGVEVPTKLQMEPSDDDDEDTELKSGRGTGTGSFGRESMHSTMDSFRSGELTLRTTQFLEELRKNPTLKLMRDELISLLQDSLDKIGIPPETRGIPDDLLISKLALLKQRRQTTVQKYPIFTEFRKQCNAHADQLARERLREQKRSPPPSSGSRAGIPPRAVTNTSMMASGTSSPVRSAQQSPVRQSPAPVYRQPAASSPQRPTPASTGQGRVPQPQTQPPRAAPSQQQPKPAPRSPQRTPHSTGSSLEWTSTQWESGEDEESEEEEEEPPAFEHVRVIKSGPAGRGRGIPAPRTQPTPMTRQPVQVTSGKAQDDDDDGWDSDDISDLEEEILPGKSSTAPTPMRVQSSPARNPGLATSPARGGPVVVQPKGQKVAELSRTIEMQLAGRKEKKLAGAVDMMGGKKEKDVLDDFSDSDWDVSPVEEDPPASTAPKKATVQVRGSHASDTTNTYGTSVWGSSSKGASTVPAAGTQGGRASRGSFVSVTDVSSDEELDLDNI
ncbi:cilium assembly protein DZIP1-like isoform X2 [Saccostrea echinata]|uniref:cilium assembly protein DZIP1-like isoform X2 n=1 Tax=Saccostrea echinata TaxID=191078 RepID=UPI002A81E44F|nr:cilium assembly protein DZIP1-like isoform X2 [Saccostrea echinata]